MKRMSRTICTLAALLMSLGAVTSANALQLKAVSQILNPATGGGGHPTWYQDQNSLAVKPAGIPLTGFPVGFPAEFFYFSAVTDTVPIDNSVVFILFALEASWVLPDGSLIPPPGTPASLGAGVAATLKATTFQRMRMRVRPTGPIAPTDPTNLFIPGIYKVDHPWGTTSFTCTGPSGNNASCQETTDITGAVIDPATGNIFGGFNNALGVVAANAGTFNGFDKFAKSTAAITGFLGDGITLGTITSAGVTPLLRTDVVITSPLGTVVTIPNFLVTGQTIGLEITPPAAGTNFGAVGPVTAAVKKTKTFNVNNNFTGQNVALTFNANIPNSTPVAASPDFTIVPTPGVTGCPIAPVTLAVNANCNFDVIFSPTTADGPKTANILINAPGVPLAQTTVTGTADSTAPAVGAPAAFARVSNPVLSGTVEALATVTVNTLPATVTNTTWSIKLPSLTNGPTNTVTVVATDAAGNTATSTTTVTGATPDGKIVTPTAAAPVAIADALLALKFAAGLSVPTDEQKVHGDVAPLVNGILVPNDKLDIGDVVLILRKVVAPASLPF